MTPRNILLFATFSLCSLFCNASLAAQQRLLITFDTSSAAQHTAVQTAVAANNGRWQQFSQLQGIAVVSFDSGTDIRSRLLQLKQLPGVLSAEPDVKVRKIVTPDDTLFSQQWHLSGNAGINAQQAWDRTTGDSDQVVMVIDTGVDYNHPDLAANIWRNPNEIANDGIDNDNNGYIDDVFGINPADANADPMDEDGHGTQVASIIAAVTDNAEGLAGVSWQTKILPCRFMDKNGEGFVSDAISCLNYALDLQQRYGINIVATNNSWGSTGFSQALYNAIVAQRNAGILFVAGAGNDGNSARFYPAAYQLNNIISVAAHDQQGTLADFSNYGRDWVHLSAPGVAIFAAQTQGGYIQVSGTSMAAPVVSGVLALTAAAEPGIGMTALRNRLLIGGAAAIDPFIESHTMTGRRLLAAGEASQGALGCTDENLQRRVTPLTELLYLQSGDSVDIQLLSISCFGYSVVPTVSVGAGAQNVMLNDDGQQTDAQAADGIFSGQWQFDGNDTTLNFPDGQIQLKRRNSNFCSANAVTEIPVADCDALVDLYYDTAGQDWLKSDNWLLTTSPCGWHGVSCANGRVSEISLVANNLSGALPASLNQLSALTVFDVSDNNLQGAFPDALLQLTQLQRLILWQNAFTGVLPPALGNLTNLQVLDLSNNRFSGVLPSGLGTLAALQQLYLEANQFSGALPTTFGQLSRLNVLWLFDNALSGRLPQSMTNLGVLQDFRYNDTDLCPPANQQFGAWLAAISLTGTLDINTSCPNTAPSVSAGSNQTVPSGSQVQLQGTVSDAEFNVLRYEWQQLSGVSVTLSSNTELNPVFTAPAVSSSTTLRFRLTASDGIASSSSEVSVIVQPLATGGGSGNNAGGESGGGAPGPALLLSLALFWLLRLGKRS